MLGDNDADNELTITITDGGLGDEDGLANGVIIDPCGTAIITGAQQLPSMGYISTDSSPPVNEKRLITPAKLAVNSLNIVPGTANINEPVTIYANVANRGDISTYYTLDLKINGQVEQTRSSNIGEHTAHQLVFTVYKDEPGTYLVDFEGQQAYFNVTDAQGNDISLHGYCLIILAVLAVLAILLTVLLIRRRNSA